MKRKLLVLLLLGLTLLTFSGPARVAASDYASFHHENVGALSYKASSWVLSSGNGIYGNFTVGGGMGISFFICDQANYNKWTGGQTASVYLSQSDVGSYSWKFSVPSSGTWYIVYDNTFSLIFSKTVDLWHCRDDTAPTIDIWSAPDNNEKITVTTPPPGYHQIVNINAFAKDNKELESFRLYIDDSLVSSEASGAITYTLYVDTLSLGTHTMKLVAEDWANHVTTVTRTFELAQPSSGGGTDGGDVPPNLTGVILLVGIIAVAVVAVVLVVVVKKRKESVISMKSS